MRRRLVSFSLRKSGSGNLTQENELFRVGQKVVCVDASGRRPWWDDEAPIEGRVYTIARIFFDIDCEVLEFVELKRCQRSRDWHGCDIGYDARRFRPIVERKTDISVFTKMLTPKKRELVRDAG
jgi:hypothetical protein